MDEMDELEEQFLDLNSRTEDSGTNQTFISDQMTWRRTSDDDSHYSQPTVSDQITRHRISDDEIHDTPPTTVSNRRKFTVINHQFLDLKSRTEDSGTTQTFISDQMTWRRTSDDDSHYSQSTVSDQITRSRISDDEIHESPPTTVSNRGKLTVINHRNAVFDRQEPRASDAVGKDYEQALLTRTSTQPVVPSRLLSKAGLLHSKFTPSSVSSNQKSIIGRKTRNLKPVALPTRLPERLVERVSCHNLQWLDLKAFLEVRFPGYVFDIYALVLPNSYYFNVPEKFTKNDRMRIESLRSNVSLTSPFELGPSSVKAFTDSAEYLSNPLSDSTLFSLIEPTDENPLLILPCELGYTGCFRKFDNADVEDWIAHSLTHFKDAGPPLQASCTICDRISVSSYGNLSKDWRTRMLHIRAHLAAGESQDVMQPDIWVLEHLRKKDLIGDDDYARALAYHCSVSNKMHHGKYQLGEQASTGSQPSKLSGSSGGTADSESTYSGDETDWDDASDLDYQLRGTYEVEESSRLISLQESLAQTKCQMIKQLMDEFWIIFNRSWEAEYKSCGETSHASGSGCAPDTTNDHAGADKLLQGTKRRRRGSGDEDNDNSGRQAPKRTEDLPQVPGESKVARHFACPYRKNDPRKYNVGVPSWKSCALTPHKTVARMKAHLYKYHLIYQCTRCKHVFINDDELERHNNRISGCEVIAGTHIDGITKKMEERLHSRKKAFKGQTEEQRWDQIFDILFPYHTGTKPTPYFEPVKDGEEQDAPSAESPHFATFENFLRRELPKIFENTLVCKLDAEIHPLEERLRAQIPDLIREATDVAFSKYRAMHYADAEEVSAKTAHIDSSLSVIPVKAKTNSLHQVESNFESHSSYSHPAELEQEENDFTFQDAEDFSGNMINFATKSQKDFDISHVEPSAWKGKGKEIIADDSNHEENQIGMNPYDLGVGSWGSQLNPFSGKIPSAAPDPQNWSGIPTDAVLGDYDLDMYLYTCSNSDDLYGA